MREDILSVFVGIRPLAKAAGSGRWQQPGDLSRDYTIHIDHAYVPLTIAGGKWTTYRHMAEDCVDHAITLGGLDDKVRHHRDDSHSRLLSGSGRTWHSICVWIGRSVNSCDGGEQPGACQASLISLPYIAAEVVWAARYEMSRTVDDALSRRTRALLNARGGRSGASGCSAARQRAWQGCSVGQAQVTAFRALAAQYIAQGSKYPANPAK